MSNGGTIKATLKIKGKGVLAELDLPKSLDQVSLKKYIDFLVECRKFGEDNQNHVMLMAQAISAFLDYPLAEILEAEIGDVYSPEVKGLDGTISTIFGYISGLVHKGKGKLIKPENANFRYDGKTYYIPAIVQQAIAGEYTLPNMSVIETIEAAEIQRFKTQRTAQIGDPDGFVRQRIMALANLELNELPENDPKRTAVLKAAEQITAAEIEKKGDPNGSLLYSMYLKMLAVICRKKNEKLPFDDAEREAWINERASHFRGINAQLALDIDFFLTSILPASDSAHPVAGFLSRQSFAVVAATRLKNRKRTTAQKTTTTRYSAA